MNRIALLCSLLALPAFAGAKTGTPQTHQCMKDGAVIAKTKKECKKEGGTWEKAAAKPADAPAADAPPPADAPATPKTP